MIFTLPIIGWLIGFVLALSLSVPLYFLWNSMASTYFYWLPEVYLHIPFWDTVWLVMLLWILRCLFLPRGATNTNNNSGKSST
jgi:hypothetical protein